MLQLQLAFVNHFTGEGWKNPYSVASSASGTASACGSATTGSTNMSGSSATLTVLTKFGSGNSDCLSASYYGRIKLLYKRSHVKHGSV